MRITCNSHSNSYLYIFKHGIGPGTLPEGVNVVKTKDLPNYYTAVWLDRFLTTDEMKQYDIPFETDINYYLDRIGYCQKDGDVVPCDDVEACGTVTAAKSSKADILDSYVGEDIWLKAKLSQKAYFRRGYTGNEYWIRIVDKDENGNYVINRVSSYKEYKGNSTQKQHTLSNTYTVDKNSITLYNPIQTATTDEIFSVEACDDITASTIPTSDIEFLAKEALNCNTRDELGSVISSLQSIDKKLYLHYMELFRDNSLSVAYIASQLSDELMSYYVDDVEACNDVMASTKRHPKVPDGWNIVPEGDFDDGRWGCIAKEMPDNSGYYWIDAAEDDRDKLYYTISYAYRTPEGPVGNIIEPNKTYYRLSDALKEVDRRIAREFDDVEACDQITASDICYRDRDNDDRVVALDAGMSEDDVEEMLAAHPSYYRSTLDRFDDVEACDDVMASEDDEDEIYWVQAYYSKPHKGLADDFATNDWDAAIDKLVEFANQGYYIAFDNLASGDGRYYDPDEVLEAVDFGDIYELRGLANLCEG